MAAFREVLLVKNARGAGDLVDLDQPNSWRGRYITGVTASLTHYSSGFDLKQLARSRSADDYLHRARRV